MGIRESLPGNGLNNQDREIVESSKATFLDAARHLSKLCIRGEIVAYGVWRG